MLDDQPLSPIGAPEQQHSIRNTLQADPHVGRAEFTRVQNAASEVQQFPFLAHELWMDQHLNLIRSGVRLDSDVRCRLIQGFDARQQRCVQ